MFNLSQEEFWNLRVNDFLYYKMIEFAAERNIQTVDFGPSSSADHTHNRFKLNFGAEEVPIYGLQSESAIGKMRKWVRHKKFNLQLRYDRFKS